MNVTKFRFNNLTQLKQNLDLSDLDPDQTLVQIFTALTNADDIAQIQTILREKNSDINYIGTSSPNKLDNELPSNEGILISITVFEKPALSNTFFNADKQHLILNALTSLSNSTIKKLEKTQQLLKQQASKDSLTNLYNRGYFTELSSKLLAMARREGRPLSAIMLNIDKFQHINDTYGQDAGDEAIKALAPILNKNTREVDIIARLDNGEFAIVLPHANKSGAYQVAERLRKAVEQQEITLKDNQSFQFTISLGIDGFISEKDRGVDIVLSRANDALLTAKAAGRNRAVINK